MAIELIRKGHRIFATFPRNPIFIKGYHFLHFGYEKDEVIIQIPLGETPWDNEPMDVVIRNEAEMCKAAEEQTPGGKVHYCIDIERRGLLEYALFPQIEMQVSEIRVTGSQNLSTTLEIQIPLDRQNLRFFDSKLTEEWEEFQIREEYEMIEKGLKALKLGDEENGDSDSAI